MSISVPADLPAPAAQSRFTRLACAVLCVALADWLFFGWRVGVSLPLFLAALGIVALASTPLRAPPPIQAAATIIFAAILAALVEDISILSVIIGVVGTALFVVVMTAPAPRSWPRSLLEAIATPLRGYFEMIVDMLGLTGAMQRKIAPSLSLGSLIAWIVPLFFFAIFLWLFASANPLIEYGLSRIDIGVLLRQLDPLRVAFWILVAGAIWALIQRRIKPQRTIAWPDTTNDIDADKTGSAGDSLAKDLGLKPSDVDHLFGEKAMARSLILFNALFLLQTGLDITYLWGGASLPAGMSHAEYAHRGAYPLIVTALLAAGFVLVAMRSNGPAKNSKWIRPLVLAWTAQNVVLVISSILRLDLYVATFTLTYLRLAAFIWMVLVAVGLLLIFVQIARRKSNAWLLSANAASLALVLYGCCFINAPLLIASYNIGHSREVTGKGPGLDLAYLRCLGRDALPAIEAHAADIPALREIALKIRLNLRSDASSGADNWRAWSFRSWRFNRYLANNTQVPAAASSGGGEQ